MKYVMICLLTLLLMTGCQSKVEKVVETGISIQEENPEDQLGAGDEEELEEIIEEPKMSYQINEDNWKVERLHGEVEKIALLTIDDAPNMFAVDMAETLQGLKVDAIFFVNGHFIADEDGKERLKIIHNMGFEIGNHTMSHPNMGNVSAEEQRFEIIELNELIEEVVGERPRFYRAPFGVNTETSKKVIKEEGMIAMNWTYGYDWETGYQDAPALAEIMVNSPYLTEGANLLMHDREWTADALPDIVNGLREKGYDFVDPHQIK